MSRPDSTQMDLQAYNGKKATALQEHFAAWIIEKTGYDPKAAKTKEQAFMDGISLGANLRMAHQASPENQARLTAARAETERKNAEKAAAKPPVAEPVVDAKPAPAKRAAKKTASVATLAEPVVEAKPAPRRRAAKAASGTAPAPF